MLRFAVIRLPDFGLQAVLRSEPALQLAAVALVDDTLGGDQATSTPVRARNYDGESAQRTAKAKIIQATRTAGQSGIVAGMTVNQARARCTDLTVRNRSAAAEATAQAALLEGAWLSSSFVEDTAPGIATVELRNVAGRVLHSVERALHPAISYLAALNLRPQIGLGNTPDQALLAAGDHDTGQSSTECSWHSVQEADDLAEFPLEALAPSAPVLDLLHRWGIRTFGAFTALGREHLLQRLGPEAGQLYDRATGRINRPLRCTIPAEVYEESAEIEHEIETLEPLLFLLRRFVEQLVQRVGATYRVPAELALRLGLANGSEHARVFKIPSPTANPDVLFRMLQTHLEGVTTEHPIVSIQLGAIPTRPVRQQFGLFETALRDPNQFAETMARLVALLGHEHVGRPVLELTHRPDAFQLHPADFTSPVRRAEAAALPLGLSLRRIRPPQPALVECDRGPRYLHSRDVKGSVTAAYGPMLLSGNWWTSNPWNRAEWDVRLANGLLCRIFEQDGSWFLEGTYD